MSRQVVFSARKPDFRVDTFASGGPGGQHQNRSYTGVRITHIPTGLSCESRAHRSQKQNRNDAFRRLAKLLVRASVSDSDRPPINNEVIRSYSEAKNYVRCHASGFKQAFTVVAKDLGPMITARRKHLMMR